MFEQVLSGYVSERAKYLEYREQPDRVALEGERAIFRGKNHEHHLVRQATGWFCDCGTYAVRGWCCHAEAVDWMEQHRLWAREQS